MIFDRDNPPSIMPPVPRRTVKLAGATVCGCGRVISGNKLLCKRCADAITGAINGIMRDRSAQELAGMQWSDDGGPA